MQGTKRHPNRLGFGVNYGVGVLFHNSCIFSFAQRRDFLTLWE